MAKGDIVEAVEGSISAYGGTGGYGVRVTFSSAPASGNLILLFFGNNNAATQSVDGGGFTLLVSATGDANIRCHARVAGGSEPTYYDLTLTSQYENRGAVGVVIEGSFADLTGVVGYSGTSASTTNTIPSSAQSVDAGTLAFAGTSQWNATAPTSFSNSFGSAVTDTADTGNGTTVARRNYTSASTGDVQTVATWGAAQDSTAGVLVLVPYGGSASIVPQAMANYRMRAA
jgi:hypothetical protein